MGGADERNTSRRQFVLTATAALGGLAMGHSPLVAQLGAPPRHVLRIGIIGSGNMGGGLGTAWAKAGHKVFFSSRNPDELKELVASAGPNSQAGTPDEAAKFGEVVLIAVPYGALPQVGRDYSQLMAGKVVIDLGNPRADRDGPMADEAIAKGTGIASAEYLPGVRLVRAFSAISVNMIGTRAANGEKIGMPIAGNDPEAVEIARSLVVDAGFEPVIVGRLERAREFDRGTPVYVKGMTASQLREALKLPPSP
jgi:8-hydroxy-5-deazaflavin:NADPH oxidoreductase